MRFSSFCCATLALAALTGCTATLTPTAPAAQVSPAKRSWNVRDFGATGDGMTSDTKALQLALDTCAISGGGEVIVPGGRYLTGSVQLGARTTLRIEPNAVLIGSGDPADYPSVDVRWEGRWQPGRRALIYAANVDHIAIVGGGRIEGNAAMAQPQNPRGSVVLEANSCTDVRWEDLTITQGGNWATHPTYCRDVVIRGLTITGRRDGIDVDSCDRVLIENCRIETGDDSISLKSGRGRDGARIARPVSNVTIRNCNLRCTRFACIGIGSEISAGVQNVRIEHCTLDAHSHAIYLKSRVGRGGVTENIVGEDLDVTNGGFLRINLASAGNTNTADDPVPGALGIPEARNLRFSNVRVKALALVEASQIPAGKPLQGLTLENITGTATKGIALANMTHVTLRGINVQGIQGPRLSIANVMGEGLEGAQPLATP
jgi:polygalacturonase